MKPLLSALNDIPEYRSLLAAIDNGACPAAFSGLSAVHRAHFAAGIRQELNHRGIPRDLWEELLSQMPPAEEAAERYLRARCRNKTVDEALLRKLSAALQRRGFSWQDIQAPLRRLESEIQE